MTERKKLCIYCGDKPGYTNDHVPPKSILIKPYPDNLPTVPACSDCNSTFGKSIDEKLKLYIAKLIVSNITIVSPSSKKFLESARRTLESNKSVLQKLKNDISRVANLDVYVMKFDLQERKDHIFALERIIKGLFYYKYNRVFPKNYLIKVYDQLKTPINSIFIKEQICSEKISIADDIFFALHSEAKDKEGASLWELHFYSVYKVWICTLPNDFENELLDPKPE